MRHNFLSHPRFQLTFTLSFVIGVVFIVASLTVATWTVLNHVSKQPSLTSVQQAILHDQASQILFVGGLVTCAFAIAFLFIGLYLSSKFIGPLTRLERWLELQLIGQKPAPIKLRKGDELKTASDILFQIIEKKGNA